MIPPRLPLDSANRSRFLTDCKSDGGIEMHAGVCAFSSRAAVGSAAVHEEPGEHCGDGRARGDHVVRGDRDADAGGELVPQPQEHRRQRGLCHQLRPHDRPRRTRHRRLLTRRSGDASILLI